MSASRLQAAWQFRGPLAIALWPISCVYSGLMRLRSLGFALGWLKCRSSSLPVIVIGNLTVGGTGKTPLCGWLVRHLESLGYRPGIVSRGHGGTPHETPHLIDPAVDRAEHVGDEPLMLAQDTRVPVCICTDRAAAVSHLKQSSDVDIVISDDGLQHLAMDRTAELVVIDAARGLGNGWMLPAGPLRESQSRLATVDALVLNGVAMSGLSGLPGLSPAMRYKLPASGSFSLGLTSARSLVDEDVRELRFFEGQRVHAVAGIGHPQRFFASLQDAGMDVVPHPMPDHHVFEVSDVTFDDGLPVMVTSKDAVKLRQLVKLPQRIYEVPVELLPDQALLEVIEMLRGKYLEQ